METVMKEKKLDILALSWPIFVELLLQMLVGNADQIMVGWRDPNGVGAIGNANQITNLLLLVFSVVCTAAMILVSQYLGAGDTKRVGRTCTAALLMNLLFGLAVSLLLILGCGPIFRLMGVHDLIFDETCLYMRIIGAGMVFQAVYLTFTAFFRSAQLMRETMLVSIFMNCLNIGGNYILINGAGPLPALGVAGAALSSGLSRLAGVVAIACLFRRRFPGLLSRAHLRPFPKAEMRQLLGLGLPTGGESLSYNGAQICIQTVCNRFAAYVVNTRVYAMLFANVTYMFGSALSQVCQVVAARLMGAREMEATHRQVMATLRGGGAGLRQPLRPAVCGRPAGLQHLHPGPPDPGPGRHHHAHRDPPGAGPGGEHGHVPGPPGLRRHPVPHRHLHHQRLAGGRGGSFFLGVVLDWGLAGLWTAMAADECIRAVLFLIRWQSGAWRRKRLLEPEQAGPM